jgi:hypothetical protein
MGPLMVHFVLEKLYLNSTCLLHKSGRQSASEVVDD